METKILIGPLSINERLFEILIRFQIFQSLEKTMSYDSSTLGLILFFGLQIQAELIVEIAETTCGNIFKPTQRNSFSRTTYQR